ncbi:hypothetical protein QTP70_024693 [Hemibagrus guttatus]|uniref:ribonuclease H n=1 Tax=Hemibagrus guttatus TaxID=175788 RepID=A0AAE0VDG0_9TELE|nr:hypothetical protein QTP70_024693 [Hemibagrus guttatus]
MESIPTGERVVIGADFNGHVGEGNRGDEEVMGKFGVKERNLEGQMVVDFAKRMDMAVVNTYFQKREEHRVTYKSGGRRTQKKRQKLRQALGGQVVLPDDWETTAEDSIQRKRLAKKKWDMDRTEENRQEYKELQRRVKREVSELYTRLDTREGEKDLYRLARQRDRDGKDVQQVRVIKDRDGRVLTSEESVQRRWKEYFEELMNEENEREKRVEGVNSVEQNVDKIRKDEVRKALKRMKSGKAVGPDDIPVEVWKCLGEAAVEFLTSLFNRVLKSERMPEEWRRSVLVLIFKNKGDMQSCSNYRGIKLMSHTMKLWERVVEARLRKVVDICEQQYGFMPRKSTTDAIFALRILMEKYRDGQRELHCVFVDLENAYDRVPREELWYCMRKSGVAEKYVRVVQDMYERSRTVVRCAVGQTEEFKVEVGLHQGSALSPFLFAIVMDQLSEEVRQESPWTMMFADDIVICSENREQVEENLDRWRLALEGRGMKVSRSKTEYMCVNEREGSETVRLQGEEVKKVQEFKYLGSTVQSNGECAKECPKSVIDHDLDGHSPTLPAPPPPPMLLAPPPNYEEYAQPGHRQSTHTSQKKGRGDEGPLFNQVRVVKPTTSCSFQWLSWWDQTDGPSSCTAPELSQTLKRFTNNSQTQGKWSPTNCQLDGKAIEDVAEGGTAEDEEGMMEVPVAKTEAETMDVLTAGKWITGGHEGLAVKVNAASEFQHVKYDPRLLKYVYEWKLCISAVNAENQKLIEKAQALTNSVKTKYMCPEDLHCTAHLHIEGPDDKSVFPVNKVRAAGGPAKWRFGQDLKAVIDAVVQRAPNIHKPYN